MSATISIDSHRPDRLEGFIGQEQTISNLKVAIQAARYRGEQLDHVLLHGPPGLGKTTLAKIISHEMGVGFRATSGPVIQRTGDLAAILSNLQPNDVLFIDEIHRLQPAIEEVLYPAMEDFQLDLVIGDGPGARTVRIDLPKFTLVGATTRTGLLAAPFKDRFGILMNLTLYKPRELQVIVERAAARLECHLTARAAEEIANRSRGTPRIAGRLLRRVRDFAALEHLGSVDHDFTDFALRRMGVDSLGLDEMDRRYLHQIAGTRAGYAIGLDTIAAALGEDKQTIEDVIEPYLLQQGLVQRTQQGRIIGTMGFDHLMIETISSVHKKNKSITGAAVSDTGAEVSDPLFS